MRSLEERFHRAMIEIYQAEKRETGVNAAYFLRMITDYGGVEAARRLLAKNAPSEGFTRLWEHNRLDLTVEALVLRPEFALLFSEEERAIARDRLEEYGYAP
jgi:hypothetical protein